MREVRKQDNSCRTNSTRSREICLKVVASGLIAIMLLGVLPANIALADKDEKPEHMAGRLLIKFNDDVSEEIQQSVLSRQGAEVEDEISEINVKVLKVPEHALRGIQKALSHVDGVEYVETDSIIEPTIIPDDTEFSKEWHLSRIQAPAAWDINKGRSDVIIAILDTGFDTTHPDLAGKFVVGYNVYDGSSDVSSAPCGHGTLVAGAAAAATNNVLGVAGLGWENKILPIKVTGPDCYTTTSTLARGITYAADHGAKVANVSFAIYGGDRTITNAAKYMYNHGGWVVAAGGNSGQFVNSRDNRYIISVGATDLGDSITTFSSYGRYIDFSAPGVGIYTTALGGYYSYASGTSLASPLTTGLVALMFSQNPNATPQQIYDALVKSAVDLGSSGNDNYYGWGRIDAGKALQMISP